MGAYLSTPNTQKYSSDHNNDFVAVGASSMQGWRNSQEDAHNSILDFDNNTSFFAVYDGHGGAEVAAYCAEKLPEFLKKLESYQNNQFDEALKEAFLGFDQTLLEPHVIELLKILAGEKNGEAEEDEMEEDDENLAELHEESHLPLNEVIGKNYKGHPSMPTLNRLQDLIGAASVNQKPQSPYLRGRRAAAIAADNANRAVLDPDSKPAGSSTSAAAAAALVSVISASDDGPGPSSSSTKVGKIDLEDESAVSSSSNLSKLDSGISSIKNADKGECEATAVASTNGSTANDASVIKVTAPKIKESEQNGNVTSSEAKTINANVATSSTNKLIKEDDEAVSSGSSDKIVENLPNGNASSSDISSSTGKGKKLSNLEEDSTDDDENDFQLEDSILGSTRRAILECGSDDDDDDEDADIPGEIMDEEEDDDDDDDEDDEEEDDADDEDDDMEDDGFYSDFYSNMIEEPGKDSGCTAVVGLLQGRDLYVANAGDSRCVISRNGKAIDMSLDHKPEDDEEAARIMNAGGKVTLDGRVNGGLNLSRAIGDHAYKMNAELTPDQQMISALPDVRKLIISPEDEFMVLACDGIWNFMSSDEVVAFVGKRIKDDSKKLSEICEELFDNCLAPNTIGDGTGCDNMTAVIVKFKPKILEMPTKLDPNETEDILAEKRALEAAANSAKKIIESNSSILDDQSGNLISMKRCASPTLCENDENPDSNEAVEVNKTKRLKTEDKEIEVEVSSTPTAPTTSASDEIVSSETNTNNNSKSNDASNSKNEANEAQEEPHNECTSTSSTTATAVATASNEDTTTVQGGLSEVSST